ncbi:MAG: RsmB/NOP family class I SAM-dependent RNA methyltransferase [archaeon]
MLVPEWYSKRCMELVPDAEEYLRSLEKPLPQSIRATARISPEALKGRMEAKGFILEAVPHLERAFIVRKAPFSLGSTPEYLLGYYYIQSIAPQMPVGAMPRGKIGIDLCAAPGGKSVQLSEKVDVLISIDIDSTRIKSLRSNLARCGVENAILLRMDGNKISELGITADRILVDAPCSGEGVIRSHPERLSTLQEGDFAKYGERQKELLKSAAAVLEKGGTLVYSVCSLSPEECEMIAEYAITELGLKIVGTETSFGEKGMTEAFGKKLNTEVEKAVRVWPHKSDTEGFFIAKFNKV